ncbi:hypothetical protein D7Y13_14950 [Corallococcus praedator]|uniref:DUF4239 domain-containing protein n=1 Tax=Corallococcus praedator TaxID=2316724 RepID=A0ABX9QL04_9BACT|nr:MULTISPECIES: hypothetical protein [Corallococcus]RKH29732.1 hypothetical protein D7X75_22405 [Corallococcus sp. CA031C]RKI09035.1 hypothetical protein D7Y13_14950 [Corallococcus praedator]
MKDWAVTTLLVLTLELVLFLLLLLAIEVAYRIARKRKFRSSQLRSVNAVTSVVFSFMGLILAFSYSEAGKRLEVHRNLVVDEANAISSVWFLSDVVPEADQPPLRDLLRRYLDERIQAHQMLPWVEEFEARRATAALLQRQIWARMVAITKAAPDKEVLLLPPVRLMAEVAAKRTLAVRTHITSPTFFFMLGLAVVGAMLVGLTTAQGEGRNWPYRLLFALVISSAVHVVVDLEYPRTGIVSTEEADSLLLELRETMH